jgi:hypothetical protein
MRRGGSRPPPGQHDCESEGQPGTIVIMLSICLVCGPYLRRTRSVDSGGHETEAHAQPGGCNQGPSGSWPSCRARRDVRGAVGAQGRGQGEGGWSSYDASS